MNLIVCSSPETINHEQDLVKELIQEGMTTFHLRKPTYSEDQLRTWLSEADDVVKKQTMIHSHWNLAEEFNLKGIHIGASTYQTLSPAELQKWTSLQNRDISSSIHNEEEYQRLTTGLSYVWLSPVFKSISKSDYHPFLTNDQMDELARKTKEHKQTKVFALGGITMHQLPQLAQRGFDGAVVLGAVWENIKGTEDKQKLIERFSALKKACQTVPIH